jgi:hypothetical protein
MFILVHDFRNFNHGHLVTQLLWAYAGQFIMVVEEL